MATPDWKWTTRAACRGEDLFLFFGIDGERGHEKDRREDVAKSICSQCPVRRSCLDFAVSTRQTGVWGGLNEDERASERRRRMRRANVAGIGAA